jgi:hypothetical protein
MTSKGVDPASQLPPEQCAYTHGQMRCPLPPTIEVMGKWMCRVHNACERDRKEKEAFDWLSKAIRDPRAAQQELQPRHWADVMVDDYMRGIKPEPFKKTPRSVGYANRIDSHEITKNLNINQKQHQDMHQIQTETDQIDDELGW